MGEFEAIGDAVTGAVAGHAVEPKAGEVGADGHTHESHCLNCGCRLEGEFCHACGQHAHVHRTLKAFFHDFLHGALHFEGKFWRTLPLLVWRPGTLTRNYVEGQRASFVSPIALFLFCVFLTFAVAGVTGALDTGTGAAQSALADEIKAASERVTELEAGRAEAMREGRPTAPIESRLEEARAELTAIRTVRGGPAALAVDEGENVPGWLRGWIDEASQNPELLFYKLKTNAYKFSWALIPISVPFVWLLFPFSRRFGLYDHTVFVTYSLCFMMLLLSAASLLSLVTPSIASIAWLLPPIHMYRQLKGAYSLGRFGAIWRAIALTMFAFIAIALFMTVLVGVGELG
jgi:hypothetical protein